MVELKVLKAYKGFCGLCIDCNKIPLSYFADGRGSVEKQAESLDLLEKLKSDMPFPAE